MNISANCPHCQQAINGPADVELVCPYCQGGVVLSMPQTGVASAPPAVMPKLGCVGTLFVIMIFSVGWAVIGQWWNGQPAAAQRHSLDGAPMINAAPESRISNAELQTLIADVYKVETSRFIQRDLLWITLPPLADEQKTCQAIANVWASRSGLDYVRVECWRGEQRLGQGAVQHGQIRTP